MPGVQEDEKLAQLIPQEERVETDVSIDDVIDGATQLLEPEVVEPTKGSFPAPFRSKIGNSTIDLSDPKNEKVMKDEYDEWWNYGKKRGLLGIPYTDKSFKPERDNLKNKWYQKYHGMGLDEYNTAK